MPDVDVYRAAKLLIDQHGSAALARRGLCELHLVITTS